MRYQLLSSAGFSLTGVCLGVTLLLNLSAAKAQEAKTLAPVEVTGKRITEPGSSESNTSSLMSQRSASSDSARLLQDIPGISLYGAGGVSSLPAIHGMADDRLRIQVDGMDLIAACPNHMNSALSYIDASKVGGVKVFAGITPVSAGGDSIGGTIQVKSLPPEFTTEPGAVRSKAEVGGFYRSNGVASGYNVSGALQGNDMQLSYSASRSTAGNYRSGAEFKTAGPGTTGGAWLAGNEVGSTAFTSENQEVGLALRSGHHLLQVNLGAQHLPFEGFPNQRMDMTGNDSTQINLRYGGQYAWGSLDARMYRQDTEHAMNMGPDRFTYGTLGMPMNTKAKTMGGLLQAEVNAGDQDIVRVGAEMQHYTLYDWWPQAGGVMGPNAFWNIDYGTRNRAGLYGEWEREWSVDWLTQVGLRLEQVHSNAGPVQGYNAQSIWAGDAASFNAVDRARADTNWDFTALARYTPDLGHTYEVGFARKAHSPNLYQRYVWSTQPMATLMNNFAGDGNGYIGNLTLRPEVAHTVSGSADWHSSDEVEWGLKTTAYLTQVQDYIDVQRCNFGQCGGVANTATTNGFVNVQYVNQSARLYGLDLSGYLQLFHSSEYGTLTVKGLLNYVVGHNETTGDNLYNIMPLNLKASLIHQINRWTHTAEVLLVADKSRVSSVRNEVPTAGYGLLNLRSSYEWQNNRLDFGIENVLDRAYTLPLGGAYVGQGASMTSGAIPWGVGVPGMGRSVNVTFTLRF